jgi:hypothetical protein
VKEVRGVMDKVNRQMAIYETDMLQTREGSECGDGYDEEAEGKV